MKRKAVAGIIIGVVVISVLVAALSGEGEISRGIAAGDGAIGIIRIDGMIVGGPGYSSLFDAAAGSETVMEQLRAAARDPYIKAVVLRLNTPGGTTAASQEIALEVDRLRQAGKKVIASMGDVVASGGYWIASRCDTIVANPGTITGSIGVIMETRDLQELYRKIGMDTRVFKSGEHKDMGSTSRDVTEEEQQIFQDMVDEMYEQFLDTVSEGRGMDLEQVRGLADGRVFTGNQALENGLVDSLGNYYDALDEATRLAGIKGSPEVVELAPKRSWWDTLSTVKMDLSSFRAAALLLDRGIEVK